MIDDEINRAFKGFIKRLPAINNVTSFNRNRNFPKEIQFIKDTFALSGIEMATLLDTNKNTVAGWLKKDIPAPFNATIIELYLNMAEAFIELGCESSILLRRPIFEGDSFIDKLRKNQIKLENNDLIGLLNKLMSFYQNEMTEKYIDKILRSKTFRNGMSFRDCLKEYLVKNNKAGMDYSWQSQVILDAVIND